MTDILLIYPPVVKPSEAPAGIAKLAGALRHQGVDCTAVDFNLEGLRFLLRQPLEVDDTWSRRALRHVDKNFAALGDPLLYRNFDRYKRAVADINRMLEMVGKKTGVGLSLSNYQDSVFSPLKSHDLLVAAERPQDNIYYPFFSDRLSQLIENHSPSFIGFSLNYAFMAERVTVVGNNDQFPEAALDQLRNAGCRVERINGDGTSIATQLAEK